MFVIQEVKFSEFTVQILLPPPTPSRLSGLQLEARTHSGGYRGAGG